LTHCAISGKEPAETSACSNQTDTGRGAYALWAASWARLGGHELGIAINLKQAMATNLRRERHARQMTQEELADRAGTIRPSGDP
jgi:hypothetical protein